MKKSELKEAVFHLLDQTVEGVSTEEKFSLIEKYVLEYQKKHDDERTQPNRGKPWNDRELRIILQSSPTMENCMKYAKLFGRGYGSIEQIYRWASTADKDVKEKRADDAFVAQIKRVAKEVGWRA